jgi:hypothetical protein
LKNPRAKVRDRREVLRVILQRTKLTPSQRKIVTTALVTTFSHLKETVMSTVQRDLVMRNPDFAVFYPNVYFDLDEEDQEEWDRRHGRRQGPKINLEFLEGYRDRRAETEASFE